MKYEIVGDNLETDDDMKQMVREKLLIGLDKHLENFAADIKAATVKIHKKTQPGKPGFVVSFDMWLPGKEHVFAQKEGEELVYTLTDLRKSLVKQIKKYKEKISNN